MGRRDDVRPGHRRRGGAPVRRARAPRGVDVMPDIEPSYVECDGGPFCTAVKHAEGCLARPGLVDADLLLKAEAEVERLREALTTVQRLAHLPAEQILN